MQKLKYISLFSGIGGMDLGLDRAGMECVAQVEIDDYCRRVLAKHWPEVPKYDDVRTVGRHNLPDCDLIAGGFPCQDISNAGKRAGIDGERSGLWAEYYRIICEVRPRYVLVENVAALLSRGVDRVLGDLATVGYDAEWSVLSACAVGAPHPRERLFILAYTHKESVIRRELFGTGGQAQVGQWNQAERCQDGQLTEMGAKSPGGLRSLAEWWRVEPGVGRMAYGVPRRLDRLGACGNAVVPQVAQYIGECIVRFDREANP